MTVVMLPVIGYTLSNAFERQLYLSIQNELNAYSYSIFTVAEVENNQLVMPDALLENQFNVSQSGLYAVMMPFTESVRDDTLPAKYQTEKTLPTKLEPLWQSQSLLTLPLPSSLPSPKVGDTQFTKVELAGSHHLLYSFSASFSNKGEEFAVTLHLIKDQEQLLLALNEFRNTLWVWLFVLMLVFVLIQIIGLLWTLKPLNKLTQELEEIEKGQKKALDNNYPLELHQVTQQVNTLLVTEEKQRKRYRNALSDLAHSLKTPLAVMQSQSDISSSSNQQLQRINQIIEHQLKRAQTAGQFSWHLGVQIQPIVERLIKALAKIYQENHLSFSVNIDKKAVFKGDEADLMEILGNILDNACKAAKHKIVINADCDNQKLTITIADDGNGIDESQQAVILSRGGRADTYQAGHGIGLAIVNDLVKNYQGQLFINNSKVLSGATFTLIFNY